MLLTVERFHQTKQATLGRLLIGDELLCYTLEDIHREPKVWGQTRIPNGRYRLSLVEQSGFNARYQKIFGAEWHPGIVSVEDVPGFDYIRWHMGNSHEDTAGCLLLGETHTFYRDMDWLAQSRAAYRRVYPIVRDAILAGETWAEYIEVPS